MKWLLSMLLVLVAGTVDAQIVVKTSEGPAVRTLPKCVQALDAEGYAAWAEWQNALAEKAAADERQFQSPYIYGLRTVTSTSGVGNIRPRYRNADSFQSFSTGGSTTTLPIEVKNPQYMVKPLIVLNPFVKPTNGVGLPDWNNLYCLVDGKIMSVKDAAALLPVPIPMETLYSKLMMAYNFNGVAK